MHRQYLRGQWNAYDRVLNLLNSLEDRPDETADQMRRRIYGLVHDLRPVDFS